ncbi:MAG TPA: hypothetical protein VF240_10655, partial [Pyrinomonadaceae bacterium]
TSSVFGAGVTAGAPPTLASGSETGDDSASAPDEDDDAAEALAPSGSRLEGAPVPGCESVTPQLPQKRSSAVTAVPHWKQNAIP